MKARPYPEREGLRIWLNRTERQLLLDELETEPRKRMAVALALHGLRTDEVLEVSPSSVGELETGQSVVLVEDGKTGRREVPLSDDLARRITAFVNTAGLSQHSPLVAVGKRQVRNWVQDVRERLVERAVLPEDALALGMHDLRRSWATDVYYSLAMGGVPIAEQLVLSWGGWAHSSTGRQTFRENYLGPIPDHVTQQALEHVEL